MNAPPSRYLFGAFELDPADKALTHRGQPVALTPKAFDTLLVLVERHGRLVGKDDLIRLVWPDTFVEDNNLAQHISSLRRTLGESATDRFIETVPRRGYRFVAMVTTQSAADDRPPATASEANDPASEIAQAAPAAVIQEISSQGVRPDGSWRRWWGVAAVVLLTAAGALMAMRDRSGLADAAVSPATAPIPAPARTSDITRIAVLPMVNLGPAADASFVSGLTEELTSRLAELRRVAVPSSTTLNAYDRRGKTLAQVGQDLRVDYVVEGSVRWTRDGEVARVRMTPRLVRVADDTTVWTQQFDAALTDILGVQADIARAVADALSVAIDVPKERAGAPQPGRDADAYVAYLRGVALFRQGQWDTSNMHAARAELEQAVARDARLAPAWSWLARVYASLYASGAARTPEIIRKGAAAAQTAIDLDPSRADLHLGRLDMLEAARDYEGAYRELMYLRTALPNSAPVLVKLSTGAAAQGRWGYARTTMRQAFDLDPASTAEVAAVLALHLREYDEARRFISVARAANQSGINLPEAWTHISDRGDISAARRVLETARRMRTPPDARVLGVLARFAWYDGDPGGALEVYTQMDAAGTWMPPSFRFPSILGVAQVYDSVGRHADAARSYAEAYAQAERLQQAHPEDLRMQSVLGLAAAGLRRRDAALRHAERGVVGLAHELPLQLYMKAQIQARVGDHAGALATLEQLFGRPGFYSDQWVRIDPSFASLRQRPEYPAAIARWAGQRGFERLVQERTPAAASGSTTQ